MCFLTILSTLGVQMSTKVAPMWSRMNPKAPFGAFKMTNKTARRGSKVSTQAVFTKRAAKTPNSTTKLSQSKPNCVLILINVLHRTSILYNLKFWCD